MERPPASSLRIGDWSVHRASGQISRNGESVRVEVRTMRLLLCLAERAPAIVSIDDLLTEVWSDVTVTPDSVYQAVTSLRRLLGDDPRQPTYIETVPRLGYRMVAKVSPCSDASPDSPTSATTTQTPTPAPRPTSRFLWAALGTLCLALVLTSLFHDKFGKTVRRSRPPSPLSRKDPSPSCPFSTRLNR